MASTAQMMKIGWAALAVIGIVYVALSLFGGDATAGYIMSPLMNLIAKIPSRAAVRAALRASADAYGLPPDWLDVIGWHESRWRLGAVGDSGRSVGPTQIQKATLARNGYDGDPLALTTDAGLAAEWTARLLQPGASNAEGVILTAPLGSLDDAIGWWNAGAQPGAKVPASTASYIADANVEIGELPT